MTAATIGAARLRNAGAFWWTVVLLGIVLGGSAVVSPLYGVYQQAWHFSAISLTEVFAVYAGALLVVLLFAGSLSDYVGRRPMIALSLAAEAGAAVLFLDAHGIGALFAARSLQGIATGAGVGALGAALLELAPADRPTLGATVNSGGSSAALAVAALGAGAVIQYGPAPTHLVFWLLLGSSLVGLISVLVIPEPGARRTLHLGALRPNAGIPRPARRAFVAALPALIASWSLGGLYFSLGPSIAEDLAHSSDAVWGGLVIFALTSTGAIVTVLIQRRSPHHAMIGGSAVLAVGAAVTLATMLAGSATWFFVATAATGIGFGASFLGAFRHLSNLAAPHERGALIGTIYLVAYLSFSVPVIVVGVITTHIGLHDAGIYYAAFVSALALVATVAGLLLARAEGAAAVPTPTLDALADTGISPG
ncbi:MAG TPA: MFS transporter [Mycobacteriales bacterium]